MGGGPTTSGHPGPRRDLALVATLLLLLPAAGGKGQQQQQEAQDGYSALCVVGKNENRYAREWVEYHKCLGFSRIYMYDHNSSTPLSSEVADHVASGFVHYIDFSGAHSKFRQGFTSDLDRFMATIQGQAYRDCVTRFGGRHRFLGFIDFDEFLVILDPRVAHVDELLRDYERYPGLSLYWVVLGSSGHKLRAPGWVISSFNKCLPLSSFAHTQFKTFANTAFQPTMYSPHRATFGASSATGAAAAAAGAAAGAAEEPYMVNELFQRIPRGRNKNSTHVRAAVYHYAVKSREDFLVKMRRGGGAGVTRPRNYLDVIDRAAKDTCDGALRTYERFCKRPAPAASKAAAAAKAPRAGGG